jgi:hypothetical protein
MAPATNSQPSSWNIEDIFHGWRDRLDNSRDLHTENRSWVNWPRARAAVPEIVDEAQQRLTQSRRLICATDD